MSPSTPPRFGQHAQGLCGLAAQSLGWRPAEFWDATPEELACVLAPLAPGPSEGLDRATLNAMMDHDNER